jgi:hypothetical protein
VPPRNFSRWRHVPQTFSETAMTRWLRSWATDDRGQDLVEYVLLGATVAFAGLLVMNTFDEVINAVYVSWDTSTQEIWEPQDPQ